MIQITCDMNDIHIRGYKLSHRAYYYSFPLLWLSEHGISSKCLGCNFTWEYARFLTCNRIPNVNGKVWNFISHSEKRWKVKTYSGNFEFSRKFSRLSVSFFFVFFLFLKKHLILSVRIWVIFICFESFLVWLLV